MPLKLTTTVTMNVVTVTMNLCVMLDKVISTACGRLSVCCLISAGSGYPAADGILCVLHIRYVQVGKRLVILRHHGEVFMVCQTVEQHCCQAVQYH